MMVDGIDVTFRTVPVTDDIVGKIRISSRGVPPVTDLDHDRLEDIAEAHGLKDSYWSMDEDPASPHPFGDATVVSYSNYWTGRNEKGFIVVSTTPVTTALLGPSYLDLWRAADKLIRESGDGHHVYIEAFTLEGDVVHLHCGS